MVSYIPYAHPKTFQYLPKERICGRVKMKNLILYINLIEVIYLIQFLHL